MALAQLSISSSDHKLSTIEGRNGCNYHVKVMNCFPENIVKRVKKQPENVFTLHLYQFTRAIITQYHSRWSKEGYSLSHGLQEVCRLCTPGGHQGRVRSMPVFCLLVACWQSLVALGLQIFVSTCCSLFAYLWPNVPYVQGL